MRATQRLRRSRGFAFSQTEGSAQEQTRIIRAYDTTQAVSFFSSSQGQALLVLAGADLLLPLHIRRLLVCSLGEGDGRKMVMDFFSFVCVCLEMCAYGDACLIRTN